MARKTKRAAVKQTIPKTLADTIPYISVFENGIIEVSPGLFSRSYKLPEVNFKTVNDEAQMVLAEKYSQFLGSFDAGMSAEISLYNKTVDVNEFQSKVFLKMRDDNLNAYRDEYNDMLLEKMSGAKNNIETIKLMTVSLRAKSIREASEKFAQLDRQVTDGMVEITRHDAPPMTIYERLELLNSIYNQDSTVPLCRERTAGGKKVQSFTLENCVAQGITTKDVIAPSGFLFRSRDFEMGGTVARSYYVSNYPTWLKGTVLTDFTAMPANILVSVYFNTVEQGEAVRLVKRQGTNIASKIVSNQKKAAREGYAAEYISPDIQTARDEADELMAVLTKDNERLFLTNFVITLFANDMDQLKTYEEQMKLIANKNLLTVKPVGMQQENAFNTSLPLGNPQLCIERLMSSNSICSLIPFDVKELRQDSGMYYGLNAASKNMIRYNRMSDVNCNGCILGMPGAGKSFAAKREMINVLLNTDNEVYVIDPEREYYELAKNLGGAVVRIANGSKSYINPFDMHMDNTDDDGDPVKVKTDFIETVCEIAIGGRYGLSPIEKSIIDRCVNVVYEPYLDHLEKTGKRIDYQAAPTMLDFYNVMNMQSQPEAVSMALSLERYVKGALDVFSHHTNIEIDNRFTVFDIKNIGSGLKELGLQICLDNIWNKMVSNKAKGRDTWFYIDEFYLLMQKPTSAAYIAEIWKRARKWNGIPTAITQNVEDMLKSEDARTVINNCSFRMLLGQAPMNRKQLCQMYDISPEEEKYISAAKPGMGLIQIGDDIIPVDDSFPKHTQLYRIMSTKPHEDLG